MTDYPPSGTVPHFLSTKAEQQPDATAIAAPGRSPLSYRALWQHIQHIVDILNALGLGRGDRIALVLPNGPEMATAFLSVAACATSAPLNPSYRENEFDFYLSDLRAKALITTHEEDTPAVTVARRQGIPVIRLHTLHEGAAGLFTLEGEGQATAHQTGLAHPDDEALVLHTSGTTSRPKLVPLTHSNLNASAHNTYQTLRLTDDDRCLNVMPLFHIHGLAVALLSSLAAGASVVCTPGFYATDVFGWMKRFRPTWYTAVPTMHQAILQRAERHRDAIDDTPLRFIRSASAALPPSVMAELEDTFAVPVVESYAMTEASSFITSNPFPPHPRKPGSAGLTSAAFDLAVIDANGALLPTGDIGEIVIKGPCVTAGYADNPEANEQAFTDGWFRTGDQGYLDEDGYLFLTGRLKEMIIRGGENIAPREIDDVMLAHPAVRQTVAFAIPDERLGEEVAAAVVLDDEASVDGQTLRRFAAERLAPFKVPRRIVIVDEIPKGPTGKLQRIGLAERLGITTAEHEAREETPTYVAPRTPVEELLATLWSDVLEHERISVTDDFLELGGDSMLATRLVARMRAALHVEVTLIDLFEAPTVADQAHLIEEMLLNAA